MHGTARLRLEEIEVRVCDLVAEHANLPREQVAPRNSLVEDLGFDSLDMTDLLVTLEDQFSATLEYKTADSVCKSVFTRQPFRISDLAEVLYMQQGTGAPDRPRWGQRAAPAPPVATPFTQLDGRWPRHAADGSPLLEPLAEASPVSQYRRRSDGMLCVRIPAASVEIGSNATNALRDEQPRHMVELDSFLMDAEPVSTAAYSRFLNSVTEVGPAVLADWFVLQPDDKRESHVLLTRAADGWRPLPGRERCPMILVSWYGANAYSLWANGRDWRVYRESDSDQGSFLPSEAQWEYAARGARFQPYPWGDVPPSQELMRYGQHQPADQYSADTLPMADVNEPLGVSPFGLNHMAGNVWQWCRDWYDPAFYARAEARERNPINRTPTQVRSERGGSWVGPAELCRSSYRRGRASAARGRCLGFRCISSVADVE